MDNLSSMLLADIAKQYEQLNEIKFNFGDNEYIFYYRYMTILEHQDIKNKCTRVTTTIDEVNGTKTEKIEVQEHLKPIVTIMVKALDKDGKRIFSPSDIIQRKELQKMPFELLSHIAAEMTYDITGNLTRLAEQSKEDK